MNDRGRQSEASNDRGRSPRRSGDGDRSSRERSRSSERGARAESSYTHGRQDENKTLNPEELLWTREKTPEMEELIDIFKRMNVSQIKELISDCDINSMISDAEESLHSIEHSHELKFIKLDPMEIEQCTHARNLLAFFKSLEGNRPYSDSQEASLPTSSQEEASHLDITPTGIESNIALNPMEIQKRTDVKNLLGLFKLEEGKNAFPKNIYSLLHNDNNSIIEDIALQMIDDANVQKRRKYRSEEITGQTSDRDDHS